MREDMTRTATKTCCQCGKRFTFTISGPRNKLNGRIAGVTACPECYDRHRQELLKEINLLNQRSAETRCKYEQRLI